MKSEERRESAAEKAMEKAEGELAERKVARGPKLEKDIKRMTNKKPTPTPQTSAPKKFTSKKTVMPHGHGS